VGAAHLAVAEADFNVVVGSIGWTLQERRHPLEGAAYNLPRGERAVQPEQLD
jgi:hypothetical protein